MIEKAKIKCVSCGMSVNDVPEDASYEEMLCDVCYDTFNAESEEK